MDLNKITKYIAPYAHIDSMVDSMRQVLVFFYNQNKTSIQNYDNWRENVEKEEYLKNPEYKIYEIKNRKSVNSLVANVKWKFLYNNKKLVNKSTLIYLGTIETYPKKEQDKLLKDNILNLIRIHFLEKSPLHIINLDDLKRFKDDAQLYYYWKNKLVELEYRLLPVFHLSQSKKDKPEQIIINIKWGLDVLNKKNKPRYILKRYTIDKRYVGNLNDSELKKELMEVTKAHINEVAPINFNPPQK